MIDLRLLRKISSRKQQQSQSPAVIKQRPRPAPVQQSPAQQGAATANTTTPTPAGVHPPPHQKQHRRVSDVSTTSFTNFSDADLPSTTSPIEATTPNSANTTSTASTTASSSNITPSSSSGGAAIHIREISYTTISLVIESWEMAKHRLQYQFENIMGTRIMTNLLQMEPSARLVFERHGHDHNPHGAATGGCADSLIDASGSPAASTTASRQLELLVAKHASVMVAMLEAILSFVGPDLETIGEMLQDLGKQHARLGVKPRHVAVLATAVVKSLQSELGEEYFDARHASAWMDLLQILSEGLTLAMVSSYGEQSW